MKKKPRYQVKVNFGYQNPHNVCIDVRGFAEVVRELQKALALGMEPHNVDVMQV